MKILNINNGFLSVVALLVILLTRKIHIKDNKTNTAYEFPVK